jgi:D-alanine-D-alanine ligase
MYTSDLMTDLNVFKQKKFEKFNRVVLDGGVLYAVQPLKKKMKRLVEIDVALNCCHGGLGEGGGVSALMEWNDVPFASPDVTASSVFMDKCMTKVFLRGLGIPTVEHIRVNESDYKKRGTFLLKSIESRLQYPVIVKPAHLGSSIGIIVARNEVEAKTAIESAFLLDDRVLIERYLENKRDVNCAAYCLHGEICVSEPECAFGDGFYSFEEKYIKRKTENGVLAVNTEKGRGRYALSGEIRDKIRSYTKTVYKRMNLFGVVRMDFLVSGDDVYLCEVNTVPGSLAYYLFCERMLDARAFFGDLIEEAVTRGNAGRKKIITTGILQDVAWRRK